MKKIIALTLVLALLLSGCGKESIISQTETSVPQTNTPSEVISESSKENDQNDIEREQDDYNGLSDPSLHQYLIDSIYAELEDQFDSEDYIIEDLNLAYVSQEYLDEVEYNSKTNVYFGYSLEELNTQFEGKRFIFTLGNDGETTVEEFQTYDDTYDKALKDVAIGTGIILVCVTVTIVTGGIGTPAATAVSMVFAAAAKTGTVMALSSGAIGGLSAGIIEGVKTGDFSQAKKAAIASAGKGFKFGAITGVVAGGAAESIKIYKSASTIPSFRESELTVLDRTPNATEQVSYINGEEVNAFQSGATRPDVVVKNADGTVHAIEVKNYDLENNKSGMLKSLLKEVTARKQNLPKGSTQEIVLDVRGRKYSEDFINEVITYVQDGLNEIYPQIPISILRF